MNLSREFKIFLGVILSWSLLAVFFSITGIHSPLLGKVIFAVSSGVLIWQARKARRRYRLTGTR